MQPESESLVEAANVGKEKPESNPPQKPPTPPPGREQVLEKGIKT